MKKYKKIEKEKNSNLKKIFISLLVIAAVGYFLIALIQENFFIGWEIYFAAGCYILIIANLIAMDAKLLWFINYKIYVSNNKIKIKDGILSRIISIPMERLYYISTIKEDNKGDYDSIFITDKKVNHYKIKPLSEEQFKDTGEHLEVIRELEGIYPGKKFFYYRVYHHGYKFLYYFYMLYRSCDRCKFSGTSMELVKDYVKL